MASRTDPITFKALGLNNQAPETGLPEGALRVARNIDIYPTGAWKRRHGYTRIHPHGTAHSLWATEKIMLYVADGYLWSSKGGTSKPLESVADVPMSYCTLGDTVYFSNGLETGKTDGQSVGAWGIDPPFPPTLSAVSGLMDAGTYLVTLTRTVDGMESGALRAVPITISERQAIQVTGTGTVYVSEANGSGLRAVGTAPMVIDKTTARGRLLRTHLGRAPYPASLIASFKGRLYLASGQIVWYTDPLSPEIIYPRSHFLMLDAPVTLLAAQVDGLYIGTTRRTEFYSGTDPTQFSRIESSPHGVVRGTDTVIPPDWFAGMEFGARNPTPCWRDTEGVLCIGRPEGMVQRITADRYRPGHYNAGASVAVNRDGLQQVLSALWQREGGEMAAFGDSVTAEVVTHQQQNP